MQCTGLLGGVGINFLTRLVAEICLTLLSCFFRFLLATIAIVATEVMTKAERMNSGVVIKPVNGS